MNESKRARLAILYVSYDGALEPLGQSQVIAYAERLARDFEMTLLSFEKAGDLADRAGVRRFRDRCAQTGIRWIPLRYHRSPSILATSFDVFAGISVAMGLAWRHRIRIVHARGYVSALIALFLKKALGLPFLFDMRAFWADEKVDAGHWRRESAIYRLTKRFERRFFESADAVVSLTEAGAEIIRALGYVPSTTRIEVIPTCTDLDRFSPGPRDKNLAQQLELGGNAVIGCVGTMSNRYLRRPMLEYLAFLTARVEGLEVLVLTKEDHERLRRDAVAAGIEPARLHLVAASFSDMPRFLHLMDLGVFFVTPVFSRRGSLATKLGEFLGTGTPVIVNEALAEAAIVREAAVGVVLSDTSPESFEASLNPVRRLLADPDAPRRCRQAAQRWFDLEMGVARYRMLYEHCGGAAPGENRATSVSSR